MRANGKAGSSSEVPPVMYASGDVWLATRNEKQREKREVMSVLEGLARLETLSHQRVKACRSWRSDHLPPLLAHGKPWFQTFRHLSGKAKS
ncbi:hypothetical protein KM043_007780 [Ampulex compressa]|nr:hypothetical protein KM043_007780 [Ampulex compressa]